MGKLKGLAGCGLVMIFGFLLMGNPMASPNFLAALDTIQLLGALLIVAGLAVAVVVLGSGSSIQLGGYKNTIDNSTKNVTIQERGPSGAVRRYTEYEDD